MICCAGPDKDRQLLLGKCDTFGIYCKGVHDCPVPRTKRCFQEQGRKFQTLQDELKSEGLAAAKTHFANIFRKEVVVRGLLDNRGAATFMCSVFQVDTFAPDICLVVLSRLKAYRNLSQYCVMI